MHTAPLTALPLKSIRITDAFWRRYIRLVPEVVIPYQWEILNDRVEGAEPSYCLKNFKIAAGIEKGEYKGVVFRDSDVYKWLEAVAYSLETTPNAYLEGLADEAVDLIVGAQQPDGYINTYYTLAEPGKRWSNLVEGHELYCAGHLIEAAVAYYDATGKAKLLNAVRRFADLICDVFGTGENQINGYPGHQEIELALVKLYKATGERGYLETARYFIEERGKAPNYFLQEIERRKGAMIHPEFQDYDLKYSQSHMPPREQKTAEGHAVRALYMYCAMADVAAAFNDDGLMSACQALWDNIISKRMYITGSIGSSGFLERFTADYDLPNDINYSETCASIGLALFGLRMASIKRDAGYFDVVERILYNSVLSGISAEGNRYFYVNPLEVWPENCLDHTSMAHVKPVRQRWFNVPCCPTNVARTLASLGQYIYQRGESSLYVNLYITSSIEAEFGGQSVNFALETSYLSEGRSSLTFETSGEAEFEVLLRVPGFIDGVKFTLNGEPAFPEMRGGYAAFTGSWLGKNTIGVEFDIKPKFMAAHPEVRADAGKVALVRGPIVYCLEETDNGANLASAYVSPGVEIREVPQENGPPALVYDGMRLVGRGGSELYGEASFAFTPQTYRAVPYGTWGNREKGEMLVWQKALLSF